METIILRSPDDEVQLLPYDKATKLCSEKKAATPDMDWCIATWGYTGYYIVIPRENAIKASRYINCKIQEEPPNE